ncbi:protein NRT1/ PTR FAMILY 5.9-like [Chenopodium quinoa]|uniref:protein NRT1/ PTR FAMILY 5.9-like n=1 Tax=Chenopodium quinoa TaxID=63459 RepID=UPI000B77EB32|nr:protein NRT1/ PTR FAMILY 5.9-like [Chenopodium quinoa]
MAGRQKSRALNKPCIMLIVIAGMERFAFKGVASNLVTYLTDIIHMSNSAAAKTVNSWCGLTSIMPLLVAPLADSLWDHYSTILVSSLFYILGLAALTSTTFEWAWPVNKNISNAFMFWSLCLISLGQGGYNPSLQAFGADQLGEEEDLPTDQTDLKKSSKRTLFFTWWYFGVCSGSLLGVSVMSYIQDTLGWSLGFAVPTLAMIASIILFSSGTRSYTFNFTNDHKVDNPNPFKTTVDGLKAAISRMFNCGIGESHRKVDVPELELQENQISSQKLVGTKEVDEKPSKRIHLSDNIKVSLRLLPIWTMLLLFAVIFQQPATFFTKQGMTMKRNIGTKFKIPPATLQGAITVSIILLMPLYDKILVPCTQVITRNEKGITVLQRMGAGMVLSIIAMVIAALVEEKRLRTPSLTIFWLLPQYILLGISDIFTVVGMQEFFYGEVPVKMRTMGIALYTSVFGVGSFLSAMMISLIEIFSTRGGKQSWFSDDMSKARLDKYYWLLAILSTFSLLVYIILCRFHKSRSDLGDENDV